MTHECRIRNDCFGTGKTFAVNYRACFPQNINKTFQLFKPVLAQLERKHASKTFPALPLGNYMSWVRNKSGVEYSFNFSMSDKKTRNAKGAFTHPSPT